MDIKSLESAVEAILFASGEPVSAERIAQALEIDKPTAARVISHFVQRFNAAEGGLRVVQVEKSFQMVTRQEYAPYIRSALEMRRNVPLTKPSMEVLAVIAYHQPVTKGYLEQVRGVDCSGIVNNLVEKGLVEERGRMELPGRPILYGTTLAFLRCFGLRSLEDLPPVEQSEAGAASEAGPGEDAEPEKQPGPEMPAESNPDAPKGVGTSGDAGPEQQPNSDAPAQAEDGTSGEPNPAIPAQADSGIAAEPNPAADKP